MNFHIKGITRETGENVDFNVVAKSEYDALDEAIAHGIVPLEITPIHSSNDDLRRPPASQ